MHPPQNCGILSGGSGRSRRKSMRTTSFHDIRTTFPTPSTNYCCDGPQRSAEKRENTDVLFSLCEFPEFPQSSDDELLAMTGAAVDALTPMWNRASLCQHAENKGKQMCFVSFLLAQLFPMMTSWRWRQRMMTRWLTTHTSVAIRLYWFRIDLPIGLCAKQ